MTDANNAWNDPPTAVRAIRLWEDSLAMARQAADPARVAGALRRLGLAYYWSGRYSQALQELDQGLASAREAQDAMRRCSQKGVK